MSEFPDGTEFRLCYPFVREACEEYDFATHSMVDAWRWKPGVTFEEDAECQSAWADGEGLMILTAVATFKPGRYPTRVFYTRTWVDPDGKPLGKPALRMMTQEKFRRVSKGYRYDYDAPAKGDGE